MKPPVASADDLSKAVVLSCCVVLDSLFIVSPILFVLSDWSLFRCAVLSVLSSFAIISLMKRDLDCLLDVMRL